MADEDAPEVVVTKYTFLKADSDEPIGAEDGLEEGQAPDDVWLRNTEAGEDGEPCRARAEYPNGDVYVGEFDEAGNKHGRGVYTYHVPAVREDPADPDSEIKVEATSYSYDGEWVDNERSGVGKMVYANGDTYHGQWEHGQRHGQGSYVKANGDMYRWVVQCAVAVAVALVFVAAGVCACWWSVGRSVGRSVGACFLGYEPLQPSERASDHRRCVAACVSVSLLPTLAALSF